MALPKITPYVAKDGTVTYRYRIWTTRPDGTRYGPWSFFPTLKAAEKSLVAIVNARNEGEAPATPSRAKTTVGEFFLSWAAGLDRSTNRGSDYYNQATMYIAPFTMNDRFEKFNGARVKALYQQIRTEGRVRDPSRPLKDGSVHHVRKVLRIGLEAARREGFIGKREMNPCDDMESIDKPKPNPEEQRSFTEMEAALFLFSVMGDDLYLAWLLMISRGLRPSEMAGLKIRDFNGNVLSIRRGRVMVDNNAVRESHGKTPRAIRSIALDESLRSAFLDQVARIDQWKKTAGPAWAGDDWLFVWPTEGGRGTGRRHQPGEPMKPRVIADRFARACEKAGVPVIKHYGLRHTAGTLSLQDMLPKVVAEMMGHDVNVLLRTYQHVLPMMHADGAAALTKRLMDAGVLADMESRL